LEEILDKFDGLSEVPADVAQAVTAAAGRPQELKSFKPQALCRAALAAASASPAPNSKVLEAVCERVADADLLEFEPADLTAVAWAMAASDHRDEGGVRAMTAVGHQVSERAWEFSTEELSKVVLAFAELRLSHQAMMAAISMEVMWKIDQFSATSLAQIVSCCARLGWCKEPMFDWVAARVIGRLGDYSPRDLANVIGAFAQASFKNELLANAVAGEVAKAGANVDEEDLARMVWAFDKLGVAPRCIYEPLYNGCIASNALEAA